MQKTLSLILLLLISPVHAEFAAETCLELSRGYWVAYETTGIENSYLAKRFTTNCTGDEVDELIFADDHIQDLIKSLQVTGIVAAN